MTEQALCAAAELRRLLAKSTPAEGWTHKRLTWRGGHRTAHKVLVIGNWWDSQEMNPADAALIVAARRHLPAILDALEGEPS